MKFLSKISIFVMMKIIRNIIKPTFNAKDEYVDRLDKRYRKSSCGTLTVIIISFEPEKCMLNTASVKEDILTGQIKVFQKWVRNKRIY